jgi:hypothetical protein
MKLLKTKLSLLLVCAGLMIPTVVSAATEGDKQSASTTIKSLTWFGKSISQTNVNGIYVPGIYVFTKDSRVARIPVVGLVVVDKSIPLPDGSYYLN